MIKKALADRLVDIACKQYKVCFDFKEPRMKEIRASEDYYYTHKIKVPTGEFGVPLPVMGGFVDQLMSKIDDRPTISFTQRELADLKVARKVSSLWLAENQTNRGNWPQKDRWEKKLAIFSGRGIAEVFSESDPEYKSHYRVVDHEDFMFEPMGGGNLENHKFMGEDNVFKTKKDLFLGAKQNIYDPAQVKQLIDRTGSEKFEKNESLHKAKSERLAKLGLVLEGNTYIGEGVFRMVKWFMDFEGEKYYLVFDWITKTWVRAQKLKDVFSINKTPWTSWATHEDAFNFLSKAPADDMRPIAGSIDILFNQILTNRAKKNSGQRAYDANIFPDPAELEWRPHGLVRATPKPNQRISDGIYEFQVGEIGGTVDLIQFLDVFGASKTGVNTASEGINDPEKAKVGIFFGNLQQQADRLGLYNKSYRESWEAKGIRFAYGAYDHLNENQLVKIIGENGVEWEELTKSEAKKAVNLEIDIKGGTAELEANAQKSKKRENVHLLIAKDPNLSGLVNPQWRLAELLKLGEYEEEEIQSAVSPEQVNLEVLSNASQGIQDILTGKTPKIYRTATTAFIRHILNYASDKDVNLEVFKKLNIYAEKHISIAQKNMERSTRKIIAQKGISPEGDQKKPRLEISEGVTTEEPIPGGTPETLSSSQEATNILQGKSPLPA